MTVEEMDQLANLLYEELLNRGNFAVLEGNVSPDFTYANYASDTSGHQQLIDFVQAQHQAFEGYRVAIDFLVPGENGFAVCWTVSGRLVGELFGYQPTGERVEYSGITVQRVEDGMAIEAWSHSDMAERLAAQGVTQAA